MIRGNTTKVVIFRDGIVNPDCRQAGTESTDGCTEERQKASFCKADASLQTKHNRFVFFYLLNTSENWELRNGF